MERIARLGEGKIDCGQAHSVLWDSLEGAL